MSQFPESGCDRASETAIVRSDRIATWQPVVGGRYGGSAEPLVRPTLANRLSHRPSAGRLSGGSPSLLVGAGALETSVSPLNGL